MAKLPWAVAAQVCGEGHDPYLWSTCSLGVLQAVPTELLHSLMTHHMYATYLLGTPNWLSFHFSITALHPDPHVLFHL